MIFLAKDGLPCFRFRKIMRLRTALIDDSNSIPYEGMRFG